MDKKRNWFGLSTQKDGSYAYLMVASSAWMSTFIYGYNVTCSLLTGKILKFAVLSVKESLKVIKSALLEYKR